MAIFRDLIPRKLYLFLIFYLLTFSYSFAEESWDTNLEADFPIESNNSLNADDSLEDDFSISSLSGKQLEIIEEFDRSVLVRNPFASDIYGHTKNADYAISENVGDQVLTTFHEGGYTSHLEGVKINVTVENKSKKYSFDVAVKIRFKTKPYAQFYLLAFQTVPGGTFEEVRNFGIVSPNQTITKEFYFDTRVKDKSTSPLPDFKKKRELKLKDWSSGKYYTKYKQKTLKVEPIFIGYKE